MASVSETSQSIGSPPPAWPAGFTVANVCAELGGIPAERIVLKPLPGMATEQDLIELDDQNLFCELIDGVLVGKTVGFYESRLAIEIAMIIGEFVRQHNLGIMTGTDGPYRLMRGNVRYPDFAFVSWNSLPDRAVPEVAIAPFAPDLAVEILSKGNTQQEMDRKLRDYFAAGVKMVWYINPKTKTALSFTSVDHCTTTDERGELVGDPVLSGFRVQLGELFEKAMRQAPPRS